ncbi:MAG TPA: DEAD/DEAH box helicase [Phycisphaerae bacterium]|nr:DEAD/DEAH box helicase [Phycisphaerae bacterium]
MVSAELAERGEGRMGVRVVISPQGRMHAEEAEGGLAGAAGARVKRAFEQGPAAGIVHLATEELQTALPAEWDFLRELGRRYLTALCRSGPEGEPAAVPAPAIEELAFLVMRAPPMRGLEYLSAESLAETWREMDVFVREQIRAHPGGAAAYLRDRNPLWRLVGRVTFHLAENKRDAARPFAFLATYTHRVSSGGQLQHYPLKHALEQYARANDRQALVSLLTPVQRAAEKCTLAAELVESKTLYQPQAWTAAQAYRFLQDIPLFEDSGIIVRVPDWWKRKAPPRPVVSVKIGDAAPSRLGADALLDFSVEATLNGEKLTAQELREIEAAAGAGAAGLVRLKGQWVEIDREKFAQALEHWKSVEKMAKEGVTFAEGMRLLSGMPAEVGAQAGETEAVREWTGIAPGAFLEETLAELRAPGAAGEAPASLRAELRRYQQTGVHWLRFMTRLGLGACLADDMGLGKTIQVLALLLHLRQEAAGGKRRASLLVAPTSLIANWMAERDRFAPELRVRVAHPSEPGGAQAPGESELAEVDLVITSYGMTTRLGWLAQREWRLVILDEAQAIKNAGARQAQSVKKVPAGARIAMTGTPIENRLSDLWSLFDFLNPGLLGSAKGFQGYVKSLSREEHADFGPLRSLVRPYILRRLKTDRRIIADLPEKTEVQAFCGLSAKQAMLYQQAVKELAEHLDSADGVQRRGIILASLMRLKQICNHPSQWVGDNGFDPKESGKFERLGMLCEELAERQERVLVFTQFREITEPLAAFLRGVFRREGLVLHGNTPVARRREMVEAFQREDGPPFFVLSLKAGGTGLNLTAASQVIHFDRWWNPAVENQATDRAFRIGQKKNVLVHKFVCRGTVEERIDELIHDKRALARDILDAGSGAEAKLTEMGNQELLRFVALDIHKAGEA